MQKKLDELANLLSPLVPGRSCDIAVYDSNGQLIADAVRSPSRGTLKKRLESSDLSGIPSVVEGPHGVFTAYEAIYTDNVEAHIIALSAASSTSPQTVEHLCRLGAWFLSGELISLHQTQRLRQLAREQQVIIDHISDGLLVVDRSGVVRYMNAPAGRILGLNPQASIGRAFRELLDFEPIIEPIFATKIGYVDRELHIDSPKRNLQLIDTAIPILGEDGEVMSIVNTFREMSRVRKLSQRMIGDRARYRFSDIVGNSHSIRDTIVSGKRAARSDASVLIYGESGTGKELVAQSIHTENRRAEGPFVAINCAALPRDLIESELFGYVAGSFTGADKSGRPGKFELASGGSIFLDEVSEMPLEVQAKLLRVLQERQLTRIGGNHSVTIDVRIIAATNRDLRGLVASKNFREDLYYRLNVIRIDVPALRDRPGDIDVLTDSLIRRYCTSLGRFPLQLSPYARQQLQSYSWPGNVRQLQNLIERLVNMTDAETVEEIPTDWLHDTSQPEQKAGGSTGKLLVTSLEEGEKLCIRAALEAVEYNVTKAASILGITRPTLYAKMKRYGFELSLHLNEISSKNKV